jgi:hypothetical protein
MPRDSHGPCKTDLDGNTSTSVAESIFNLSELLVIGFGNAVLTAANAIPTRLHTLHFDLTVPTDLNTPELQSDSGSREQLSDTGECIVLRLF